MKEESKIWLSWTELNRYGKPCSVWGNYFPNAEAALIEAERLKAYRYVGEVHIEDEVRKKTIFAERYFNDYKR